MELYAEDRAEAFLREHGWQVRRVGALKLGYDLECTDAAGRSLHAEVKGTQSAGEEVFLTRNEALHCGLASECDAEHALFVVSAILISKADPIRCTGGTDTCVLPWIIEEERLTPTTYS